MRIYDLTHKLDSSTQVYPGDPPVSCTQKVASVKTDGYSVTQLSFGSHSGTHVDAPSHFFDRGDEGERAMTVDELDLSLLVGPAVVLDLPGKRPRERIGWVDFVRADVESLLQGQGQQRTQGEGQSERHRILLVRTGWSKYWKTPTYYDHPYFDKEVAIRLVELGVRVFGVDTLSPDQTPRPSPSRSSAEGVDGGDGDFAMHETLLASGTLIVENLTNLEVLLSLQTTSGGSVHVSLLPLAITGCDGSPIRAVAWVPDS